MPYQGPSSVVGSTHSSNNSNSGILTSPYSFGNFGKVSSDNVFATSESKTSTSATNITNETCSPAKGQSFKDWYDYQNYRENNQADLKNEILSKSLNDQINSNEKESQSTKIIENKIVDQKSDWRTNSLDKKIDVEVSYDVYGVVLKWRDF